MTARTIAVPATAVPPTAGHALVRRGLLRPQVALLALVALAPYDGLLLLAPVPAAVDGWKLALVAVAVWLALLERSRWTPPQAAPAWAVAAALLVAWSLVSVVLHPSWQSVVGFRINYVYLLIPLVLWRCPFDAADRDRLVTILMGNGVVAAAFGIVQQLLGHERLHDLGYEYDSVIRSTGGLLRSFSTFAQPFQFAFFVAVALLVGIPVALEDRSRRRNRLFLMAVPLLVVGMGTAIVRGALLGTVAGLVYLGFTRYRVLAHALVPLPVVAVLVVSSGVGGALLSSSSLEERASGWVTELTGQPLRPLGQGIGTTGATAELFENAPAADTARARESDGGVASERYQADNQYVKVLIELGPIGLWLFACVVVAGAVAAHRTARGLPATPGETGARRSDRGLAAGVAAATVGAAVAGVVATYWEIFPVDLLFWTLLGVLPSLADRSS